MKYTVEFSDGIGFYSEESNRGYGYVENANNPGSVRFDSGTMFKISRQKFSVKTDVKGYLMDFVVRFVWPKEDVERMAISDRVLSHRNSNVYNQYRTDTVKIYRKNERMLQLKSRATHSSSVIKYMYVRDEKDLWIVHIRLMPSWDSLNNGDTYILKNCVSWLKRPLIVNGTVKSWNKRLLSFFLYRPEKKPIKNPIIRRVLNFSVIKVVQISEKLEVCFEAN